MTESRFVVFFLRMVAAVVFFTITAVGSLDEAWAQPDTKAETAASSLAGSAQPVLQMAEMLGASGGFLPAAVGKTEPFSMASFKAVVGPLMDASAMPVWLAAMLALLALLELALALGEGSLIRFIKGLFLLAACVQSGGRFMVPFVPEECMRLAGQVAAAAAVILLPQIGRMLMHTRSCAPWVDMLLLAFATPCACLAAAPLIPKFAWTAEWLSFWPLTAVAYVLPSFVLCIRGVHGAGMFTASSFALGMGAVCGILAKLHPAVYGGMDQALPLGIALSAFLLTASASLGGGYEHQAAEEYPAAEDEPDEVHDAKGLLEPADAARIRQAADELLGEACRFDQIFGIYAGEEARKRVTPHADAMVASVRRIADAVEGRGDALPAAAEYASGGFNLREVVQQVIAEVSDPAGSQGTALSWHVSPGLDDAYSGEHGMLSAVLVQLMLEVLKSSKGGAVSIRVEPSPTGFHAGSLRFTVSGSSYHDFGRGDALSRSFGLLARTGGSFKVESGPSGVSVRFDMELGCMEGKADDGTAAVPVIIAAPDGPERPLLRQYLSGMGLELWEVRTAAEAAALRTHLPAALIVMDGHLDDIDMAAAIAEVRNHENVVGAPAVPFLLLALDEEERDYLEHAGCDTSIPQPVVRRDLRMMVRWLMAPLGSMPRPVLTNERVTVGDVMSGERGPVAWTRFRKKNSKGAANAGCMARGDETDASAGMAKTGGGASANGSSREGEDSSNPPNMSV